MPRGRFASVYHTAACQKGSRGVLLLLGAVLAVETPALAQAVVTLPDTSQTTAVTANLSEQATVRLPAAILFAVSDVSVTTPSAPTSVQVTDIIRATTTKTLQLSLRAHAATFTPPAPGAATWAAADVSWSSDAWAGAAVTPGSLTNGAFVGLASCGTSGCSTSNLVFTLAPNSSVRRSGAYRLTVTWKIESLAY